MIYLEDQYLWSPAVVSCFAAALRANPTLRLIAVVPSFPDQDGRWSKPPNLLGRQDALDCLYKAGGDRVAVYGLENQDGFPIYVHAKVCLIDDVWCAVGSGNLNRRSWTHDSELSCAVMDDEAGVDIPAAAEGQGSNSLARSLRLELSYEHLGRADHEARDLLEPAETFAAFAESAALLDEWHARGRAGKRPPGQLRRYTNPVISRRTRVWATPLYRTVYDPDGRSLRMRLSHRF